MTLSIIHTGIFPEVFALVVIIFLGYWVQDNVKLELKYAMPKDLLRTLRKTLENYGAGITLSDGTGISYNTIAAAAKTGLATKKTTAAIQESLNQLEAAA